MQRTSATMLWTEKAVFIFEEDASSLITTEMVQKAPTAKPESRPTRKRTEGDDDFEHWEKYFSEYSVVNWMLRTISRMKREIMAFRSHEFDGQAQTCFKRSWRMRT